MIKKTKNKNQKSEIKNIRWEVAILIFAFCILHFDCSAQLVSTKELIENAQKYNGRKIIFQGEIIGDVMERKGSIWINLWDGESAIGVFLKKELLPPIKFVGGYKAKGDILEVEGIFYTHCLEHGGDIDIHAEKIRIIKEGFWKEEKVSPLKKIWTERLFVSGFFLFICILLRNLWERKRVK